ncbi:MAG: histidinol-phosphate transaminase [Burkholderiaceae bacterium]|nr:MAG: histidinol-phosphate transaminase [Burkholderiaceae bacterium]
MSRFWSRVVHDLVPYVPGEQPKIANLIKLNTNENPYGPSPQVLAAIRAATDETLKLYPDPNASALKQTIAAYHGLQMEQVFVGNGSDEVLAFVFQGLLKHDAPLLFPDITYSFYPVYCGLYGVSYRTVPLRDDFTIAVDDYAQPAGAIIFPNPNAPTGHLLPLAQIEALLQQHPDAVVVIDEAYVDFGGIDEIPSAIALVNRYPNLLVVQTLSKARSLAGLRVGFAIGHKDLIEGLERVKNSFNSYPLDRLAIAGAVAAFEDRAYFETTRNKVIASREQLVKDMQALGFEIIPSAANFIFARHPQHDAATLATKLRQRSILVRHFKLPRIEQYLRITVGTDGQCGALVDALKEFFV